MATSSFALFHGVPALYAPLPSRQRPRRTATNIMAGCFDPLPALASDSGRDDSSSSQGSILTITEEEDTSERILAGAPRGKNTGWKALKAQKGLAIKRASDSSISGKGKQVRRVVHEEKENALSDSDSGTSLSPFPASAAQRSLPPTDVPKASGFWRARSSNTPEGSSSALKRKLSSLFDDDSPSPPPSSHPTKKSRLATSVYSDILSPASLTSLSESPDEGSVKTYVEKLMEAVKPHISEVSSLKDSSFLQCKLCIFKIQNFPLHLRAHFSTSHPEIIANLGDPLPTDEQALTSKSAPAPTNRPPEHRQRGPRKNVAIKKGWKGWVEEDLEPQKLILLDKPEVLPERTTRSGRKID